MPDAAPVRVSTYRAHRLETRGDPRGGWRVAIRPPDDAPPAMLRNSVPNGLEVLLEEARMQVDRRLDGAPWHREP